MTFRVHRLPVCVMPEHWLVAGPFARLLGPSTSRGEGGVEWARGRVGLSFGLGCLDGLAGEAEDWPLEPDGTGADGRCGRDGVGGGLDVC